MWMMRVMCLLLALVPLAGCETVKGVGKDVQKAGEAMERTF